MNRDQLEMAFKFYDKNDDQEITPEEIKTVMMRCMCGNEEKAEDQKKRILAKCDLDSDGRVTFEEFKKALSKAAADQ